MPIMDKPLCIIPARGGSKRIPRKNIVTLLGKPLLAYAIEAAKESNVFDCVCVSSEDNEILVIAEKYGADLSHKRPPELATDAVQVKHVCRYLLEEFAAQGREYPIFALTLATNPLRKAEHIRAAYDAFKDSDANFLMSLHKFPHPPQQAVIIDNGFVKPAFGVEHMKQSQLIETMYRDDGSIILARSKVFLEEFEFYGTKVMPFIMPENSTVDIDNPLDLAWAEFLLRREQAAHAAAEAATR